MMAEKPRWEGEPSNGNPPSSIHADNSDGDDDLPEEDQGQESEELSLSENELNLRFADVKKIKKLARLLALVKKMNTRVNKDDRVRKRRRTTNGPLGCDSCTESFVCFASLNTHSKKEHSVDLLQCIKCGKECSSLNLLRVHIKVKHENKKSGPVATGRFPCQPCGTKFLTESALILHKFKKHGEKLAIICPFCDRVFNRVSNAENLYNHTVKEHNDKRDSQEFAKILKDFQNFREKTSDIFSCKECDKSYESSNKLKSHQYKVHNNREPSFLCDKCDKVFKFRGDLNFHYQKHHSGTVLMCQECGKSFTHKYNLDIHIKKVHVGNKSLSCDTCGKMFFILSKLEHHKKTVHEKLKPFQCEFCAFKCAAHGNLNLHRRTQHGAEKLTVKDYNNLHGIVAEKRLGGAKKNVNLVSPEKDDRPAPPVILNSPQGYPTPGVIRSTSSQHSIPHPTG